MCRIRPTLDPDTGQLDTSHDSVSVFHREQTGEEADRVKFPGGNCHWADRVYEQHCECRLTHHSSLFIQHHHLHLP